MDLLVIGDYLVSFEDNRITADRTEATESEDSLLKEGAIKRIDVLKKYGTKNQTSKYLEKLSELLGEKIELISGKKIKFRKEEHDFDNFSKAISSTNG